nr:DNA mismatch repair protein MutS [Pontibacter silvestris]
MEKKALSKSQLVSWLRLVVFVVGIALVCYFFSTSSYALGVLSIVAFYILFVVVVRWHSRLNYIYNNYKLLRELNLQEIDRLAGRLQQFDLGQQFADDQHAYTSDLDIFGKNSLFQLINRSVTTLGKQKLADWMRVAAVPKEVLRRQQAVAELAQEGQVDWLQDLHVKSRHYKHQNPPSFKFFDWLRSNNLYQDHPYLKILIVVLPVLTMAAIAAYFNGYSGYVAGAFLVAQFLLAYRFQKIRDEYYDNSMEMYEAMRSYKRQIIKVEQYTFHAPLLVELQDILMQQNYKASVALARLERILDYFSYRLSTLMAFFLNTVFMWDFIWIYQLEKWRKQYVPQVEGSLDVLANFEALASIASFQFANPGYAVPVLSHQPFDVRAQQLAHPLIFSVKRIANDFEMQGAGSTMVITGSNMSGKTTFLRTVGINMVMAFTGGPVCADRMIVAPVQVYTAMRTADDLSENTSSFYAELKRLRILLELTEQGAQPVFYLLDEILKGTNSRDRHQGAMALIRQLHQRNASGLISTHDLELGAMEEELPGSVFNYSFNSMIEGDKIMFDYTLRKGVCRSFNASKLMQLMGIAIADETGTSQQ